ncbi:MAG: Flp family type IVb pilin [Acidobacteria bacterium]|nr:Flp family type IVb pilin [Acidobacteriota bacterium]
MREIWMTLLRLHLWREERGQDLVEYALLASLTAVASALFVPELSVSMNTIYSRLASKLVQAAN